MSTSHYGISEYPDIGEITVQLKNLTSNPKRTLTAEQLSAYQRSYEQHAPTSRAAATEAEAVIPGGVQHNLALNDPWPLGPRKDMLGHMSMAFAAEGVVTLAGSRLYTSMADTDDVIDDALAKFDRVFAKIASA